MNIEINKNKNTQPAQNNRKRPPKYNPLNSIVFRTLICIVVIDLTIWGYFRIKGVSVGEGFVGWQKSFRNMIGLESKPEQVKKITKTVYVKEYRPNQIEPNRNNLVTKRNTSPIKKELSTDDEIHDIEIKASIIGDPERAIYSWRDEKGRIQYSNTGFPDGNIEKLWVRIGKGKK